MMSAVSGYYRLNSCILPEILVEILSLSVMVFGGEALGDD